MFYAIIYLSGLLTGALLAYTALKKPLDITIRHQTLADLDAIKLHYAISKEAETNRDEKIQQTQNVGRVVADILKEGGF